MADADVYEILYGHKPGTVEPAEFKIFRKIANKMMDLKPLGLAVVREVAIIGVKNGLEDYLPYMFFAFHAPGSNRNWPDMPHHLTEALRMGRWVLSDSATVPNYSREIVTPPSELERNVDRALRELAEWCLKGLRNKMTIQYFGALQDNMAAFGRVPDELNAASRLYYIKGKFEERVQKTPFAFPGGDYILRMIRFMAV